MLWSTVAAGAIAYVPNVYAAWLDGAFGVVVLDTLVLGIVVALAVARRMPFRLRASIFVAAWYLFAGLLIWLVGPIGSGIAWWLAAPMLATLFFGGAGAGWGVGLSLTLGVLGSIGIALDTSRGAVAWSPVGYNLADWIGTIVSVTVLSGLVGLVIVRLTRELEGSNATLAAANDRLEGEVAERRRLERALIDAAETRALASLAGSVAHDLNNLLVPLLAAGTDARDDARPGTLERRRLDLVVASAERAQALARRILVFRTESYPERSRVAVADVARDAAGLLEGGAAVGVAVRTELDPEVCVAASEADLHQVIMNLGGNALRAVAESGGGRVTVRVARQGAHACLEVEDDGVGIAPEALEHVFEPSFTTYAQAGGTGLGLAIVRHVVRSLGGHVEVRSELGSGTTFTVRLPLSGA